MNPLSKPLLCTRTVHVEYNTSPASLAPRYCGKPLQKVGRPVGRGGRFVVVSRRHSYCTDGGCFRATAACHRLRCRRAQLVGEYISRGCARARVKIDSEYCVLPESRRGFGEGSELGLLSRFGASGLAYRSKIRPGWLDWQEALAPFWPAHLFTVDAWFHRRMTSSTFRVASFSWRPSDLSWRTLYRGTT